MRFDSDEDSKDKINYRKTGGRLLKLLATRRAEFISALLLLSLSSITWLANPVLVRHMLDHNLPQKDYKGLITTLAVFLVNGLAYLFFTYRMQVRLEYLAQSMLIELKQNLVNHLLGLHLGWFDKTPVGKISARVQSDTDSMHNMFTGASVTIIRNAFILFGGLGIMIAFNLKLALVTLVIVPPLLIMARIFVQKSTPRFLKWRKVAAEMSGFIGEQLQGIAATQAYNRQEETAGRLEEINDRKFKIILHAETLVVAFFLAAYFCEPVVTSLILGVGGHWAIQGKITIGVLIMFIMYMEQFIDPLMSLSEQISQIQRSFAAAERIFNIMDTKPAITDPPKPHYLARLEHNIEFRNVWLRYAEEAPWALKDVSFSVRRGERLAIVGETGGGKTTVISALFRFYPVQKGEILFDGMPLNNLAQSSLRSMLGLVQQDIYLFPGTMMDNLRLMDTSIPESRVHDAIRSAGLDEFFTRHALSKVISEKGGNLSQGERQVVSIVRAMVMDPPVIVFDEATASVDPHTERIIQSATERLFADRTCVVIAHRLSTIRNAEQILVIGDGEIRERGTHAGLMEQDGIYARYFQLQFGQGGGAHEGA